METCELGGVTENGEVMENGEVVEKGGEMEQKSAAEFPVSEQRRGDEADSAMHICEVCGMCFETRRGLSSHARSHLRQLGVCVSESSGAPISLLYELITERDGALPFTPKHVRSTTTPKHATNTKHRTKHGTKHTSKHGMLKQRSGTKLKIKIGDLVKRQCAIAPVSLKDSSPSSSPFSSSSSSSSPLHHNKLLKTPPILSKPLGAPQGTEAYLDLMEMSDFVHVCELCGAWYETKRGLANHARTHLRHFGVEQNTKAPPIQDPEEPMGRELPTALLNPPPLKKKKKLPSARQKTERGSECDLLKIANCEFCGEKFRKTQSLASHARSHLRQLGVTDWTVHGSPMATLRKLMAQRSCGSLPPFSPDQAKSPSEAPPLPASGPTPSRLLKPPSKALPTPALGHAHVRVPKARKGSRMVVSKPKEEPVELDISQQSAKAKSTPLSSPQLHLTTDQSAAYHTTCPTIQNLMTGSPVEVAMAEPVRCDYCGDLFDSRKALSCHARAHLRHLGVKWAPCASPIDTLAELMIREGRGQGSEDMPSPVDFCREKTEMDGAGSACESTCELCGFDFENKKALASHARAHLRQQGQQWSSNQSPIAVLSQWMSREPEKVAALHQLYMHGSLPLIRKRRLCSSVCSSDADSSRSSESRPTFAARQGKTGAGLSFSSSAHRKLSSYRPITHSADHGFDRRLPKPYALRIERAESLKRVGNVPSLVPRPPETSLVKLVGKIYSLKCRFCELVFSGPLSVQEDWLIHLRHHILNLKKDHAHSPAPILIHSDSAQLIGQAV